MAGSQPESEKKVQRFYADYMEALRYKVTYFLFKWLRAEPGQQV